MSMSDDERYRRQQEEFVSNHGGTTPQEIVLVLLPNVCSVLLTMSILGLFGQKLHPHIRNVLEFSLTIVPCIFCCTVWSEYLLHVCAIMLILSLMTVVLITTKSTSSQSKPLLSFCPKNIPFITNFRAWINIITVVCILAVDFKVFPRKFAKTEVYGYSVMDTGVGLFIIANALVAPEARKRSTDQMNDLLHGVFKSFKSCVPLLMLGFGRFITIEYLGYQKHVTEYGVHWNFFITLAFVKLFTSLISKTISSKYSLLSGVWLLIMYEYGLNLKSLKEWVLSDAPRNDFISANREGLISIPGYVGLYFIGVSIGKLIHSTYQNMNTNSKQSQVQSDITIQVFKYNITMAFNQSMILCLKLTLIASQACGVTLFCDSYFSVSRRLANSGYCAWIITLSSTLLTLLLLVDITIDSFIRCRTNQTSSRPKVYTKVGRHQRSKVSMETNERFSFKTPEIFEAINYNGLSFFLFANILTGVVNMSIRTLDADSMLALKILVGYMTVNIISTLICYRLKVQIKL